MYILTRQKREDLAIVIATEKYPNLQLLTSLNEFNDVPLRDIKQLANNGSVNCSYQTKYKIIELTPEIELGDND